ncbi:MAG: glycosyltransferase [Limnohabitans sp.]|nr:glycosyltransferase [Limnohabitans sp.]
MEIIHLILGKANPERMNGVNKVVFGMASHQESFGEKVIVWGITKDKEKNYPDRNFETRLFLKSKNPFGISTELKNAILEKKDKAIFHFHGGWIPVYYTLSKFLNKHSIPFVVTPHGAYNAIAMKKSQWLKKIYYSFFEKNMLRKASKIHCLGQSELDNTATLFESDKAILIPYGYESNLKNIACESKDESQFIFGFIGRLDIYTKGLDKLIDGFQNFFDTHPNARLWMIGDSDEKEVLKKMIEERNLTNKVVFFGSKFGKQKETLLKNIDVFVHPSRNEGLPASVIEAASFGKPCLVSKATNVGEMIQEYNAGKMIDEVASNTIATAMEELYMLSLQKEDFKNMGHNAIKMIKENFNWNKIIHDYKTQLYQ